MKLCWFSGPRPALAGYHYEAGDNSSLAQSLGEDYTNVKILDGEGSPAFEIQFHKYNDNTLIVTRNFALSSPLLTKVNRDIQLWALSGPDCTG